MKPLDHRAARVVRELKKEPPKTYTEAMLKYREHIKGGEVPDEHAIAFAIHESPRQKEIMEALLLSSCPLPELRQALDVPESAAKIYAELFFDQKVFRTGLDRLEYLEDYPDPFGKDLKVKAVNLGYEFVLFTFANLVPKTAGQKKLIEKMFMATAYKAMAMNYSGIKSEANRQAVKHAELMMKAYELLAKINADEGAGDYDLVSFLALDENENGALMPADII